MAEIKCEKCETSNKEGSKFCKVCGSKLPKNNPNKDKDVKSNNNKSRNSFLLVVLVLLILSVSLILAVNSFIGSETGDLNETTRFSVGASTFAVQGNWTPKSAYNNEMRGDKKVIMERNGKELSIEQMATPIYSEKETTQSLRNMISKQYTKNNNTYYISISDSNWGYFYFKGYEYHFSLEDGDLTKTEELISYLIDNAK